MLTAFVQNQVNPLLNVCEFIFRISPNLKSIVYCTALREGSYQEWYFAYKRYMETTSASEKEIILDSLGCTTKPWLLAK